MLTYPAGTCIVLLMSSPDDRLMTPAMAVTYHRIMWTEAVRDARDWRRMNWFDRAATARDRAAFHRTQLARAKLFV